MVARQTAGRTARFARGATLGLAVAAMSAIGAPARGEEVTKPYDTQLLRLSEILGAVHYLRALCGFEEGQVWREQMLGVIESEGSSPLRKVRFTQSFNRGYRSYQRTYRRCNRSAETALTRFLAEGREIAETLAKEYE
ncbi:MAG: TIGR02301 family protein [Rhizobiales bacterium]|nr:TIGR02301 family protein [Hyphomicrobiales bacterium]